MLGHTPSRALLAWLFLHAREGIAINRHAALELVEEGASSACHHCQGVLAYCLWTEPPPVREMALAIIYVDLEPPRRVRELAMASSIRGSAYGQYVLGILEEDENAALEFFRLAAEQHLDAAQFALGKAMHESYISDHVSKVSDENHLESVLNAVTCLVSVLSNLGMLLGRMQRRVPIQAAALVSL